MEEDALQQARTLIASQLGLLLREQDVAALQKVVDERLRSLHLSGVGQYCRLLASEEGLRQERELLVTRLTPGETYFFRDSGQHALLKERILPSLLERRMQERALRIWCAACATGEEAYSLAILLDELMADQSRWNILILGTDINQAAVEKARQGIYGEWSFRGMSDERRQRYFRPHENAWVLDEAIRNRVTFRPGDLVADPFPTAADLHDMDLILCRNTFIYMDPQAVSSIADKFTDTLAEGGILVTGHGELYSHHLGKLRARVFPESIVYQKVSVPFDAPAPAPRAAVPHAAPRKARPDAPLRKSAAEIRGEPAVPDIQQAWKYANSGERERAAQFCGGMIAKNPLDAEPHYLLALLAQERGGSDEAKELLKKAIYLDPSFIAAYLDLGDLYAREGDRVRAARMRTTARDLLKALPGDGEVKLYGASTVNSVLQYVEHLLRNHD